MISFSQASPSEPHIHCHSSVRVRCFSRVTLVQFITIETFRFLMQPTGVIVVKSFVLYAHNSIYYIYRVSQEECVRLREGVPYVKVYRYNPKHLGPKLNGYRDNGQRKVWSSGRSTHCTCQLTTLSMSVLECGIVLREFSSCSL